MPRARPAELQVTLVKRWGILLLQGGGITVRAPPDTERALSPLRLVPGNFPLRFHSTSSPTVIPLAGASTGFSPCDRSQGPTGRPGTGISDPSVLPLRWHRTERRPVLIPWREEHGGGEGVQEEETGAVGNILPTWANRDSLVLFCLGLGGGALGASESDSPCPGWV